MPLERRSGKQIQEARVTTIPIATVLGYLAGGLIAFASRAPLARTQDPVRTRYFAVAALYGLLAAGPAQLLLYVLFPDWSLMYLADPAHLPLIGTAAVVFAVAAGAPLAGFLVTHRLLLAPRRTPARLGTAVPLLVLASIAFLGRHRIARVAYYQAYHLGGDVLPIEASRLVLALPLIVVALVVLLVWSFIAVRRHASLSSVGASLASLASSASNASSTPLSAEAASVDAAGKPSSSPPAA